MDQEKEHLKALRETLLELKGTQSKLQDKLAKLLQSDSKNLGFYKQQLTETNEMIDFLEQEFKKIDSPSTADSTNVDSCSTASTDTVVGKSTNTVDNSEMLINKGN